MRLREVDMRTFLIACAGALALAGAAGAQQITTQHLAILDTSGDGAVDAAEFEAFGDKVFTALDANGDGYVTRAEAGAVLTDEQFAAANTNGDDGLGKEEFEAATLADFAAADQDGDGVLN
jgi:EF hand